MVIVPPIQSPPRSDDFNGTVMLNLRKHPFQCRECDYSSKTQLGLSKHKKTHGRFLYFKCPWCSYSCTRKCTLTIHLKTQHLSLQLFEDDNHGPSVVSTRREVVEKVIKSLIFLKTRFPSLLINMCFKLGGQWNASRIHRWKFREQLALPHWR